MALTPADTTASLFGCTFPLFHDPSALAFTLGFLDRITREVPVRALRFTPDASVIDIATMPPASARLDFFNMLSPWMNDL